MGVAEEGLEEDWVGGERAVEVQEGVEVGLAEAAKVGAEERTRLRGADRRNLKTHSAGQAFLRSHKL